MNRQVVTTVRRLVARRRSGETLGESEAQEITAALGLGVPRTGDGGTLPGDRVVVKVVGPAHKTDLGGVRVVPNRPHDIARARADLSRIPGAEGVLVAEFVDHDPAGEIIAGVRWTDAFGPVVSIGPGGTAVGAGPDPAIVSPATRDRVVATLAAAPATRRLVEPQRGKEPVATVTLLADLVDRLLDLGVATMPHDLLAFEMNPVVVVADRPVALDALAVVGGDHTATAYPDRDLRPLLDASTIAVMGVSERMNPGRVILRNLLATGFPADRITVVKPGETEVDGCRAVPNLSALGDPVDLLVVAIPAEGVPAAVAEVATGGRAHAMILIPGGLGERPGTAAAAASIRTALDASPSPPAVLGPNSMGVRTPAYDATFIPPARMTPGERCEAPVAVVAQSGAFILSRVDRLAACRPRYEVSVGNQLDLTLGDLVSAFADDPTITVIACYLEGLAAGDGDRILRAARRLSVRGGRMLWYHGGRTASGAAAAATHTAAIATDELVSRSLGAEVGIVAVSDLADFDDLLQVAAAFADRPRGGRVAVVSNAGFECVAAADNLGGLVLADLAASTRDRITAAIDAAGLGGFATPGNPADLTPLARDTTFAAVVTALLDDPDVDAAIVGCVPFTPAIDASGSPGSLPDRLAALADHPTPWVAVVDAGPGYDDMADHLAKAGIPVLRTMDRAVRALGRWMID